MSVRRKAFLAIIVSAVLWASTGATAKTLFLQSPPLVVATQRFFIAACIIFPFFLRTKKPKGYFIKLLPLGIFNAGNVLFYFAGLSHTTANTASILGTAAPLTTTLLAWLFIKERPTATKQLGILIGMIGALCIVLLPLLQKGGAFTGSMYGNVLLSLSLLSWSLYIVYARYALSGGTYSPILSTSINIFSVLVISIITVMVNRQNFISPALFSPSYLPLLIYIAVVLTIGTFFLFQWGVSHVSASTASLKEYIQLVCAVALNTAILHEQLTGAYIIGALFISIGVFIATGERISTKLKSLLFAQNV